MIAHRLEDALEHLLHTLDGILVPRLADDGLRCFPYEQRCRGDAAEGEPGPPYSTGVIAIERHRRRDRADVIETPLGHFVEPHERGQRFRNLDSGENLAALERRLPVSREERCERLHPPAVGPGDMYRRVQNEKQWNSVTNQRCHGEIA